MKPVLHDGFQLIQRRSRYGAGRYADVIRHPGDIAKEFARQWTFPCLYRAADRTYIVMYIYVLVTLF